MVVSNSSNNIVYFNWLSKNVVIAITPAWKMVGVLLKKRTYRFHIIQKQHLRSISNHLISSADHKDRA